MLFRLLKDMFAGRPAVPSPEDEVNPLAEWFTAHQGRRVFKWMHYLDIYHRHFSKFRGRSPVVLEIGIFDGGSLDMWRDYFGPGCRIYGVDVDERCRAFAGPDASIIIGDQGDREFLARLRREVPKVDILIDDGGHRMNQQIATFEELYSHVSDEGIYLCEDMHTSYWPDFGGGYRNPGSFVEYSKRLVDQLSAWHSKDPVAFAVDDFTRSSYAMHFYDSVLVIEKQPRSEPRIIRSPANG